MLQKCLDQNCYRGCTCPNLSDGTIDGDEDGVEDETVEETVDRMAELMLGAGDWDFMFPSDEDLDMHFRDEMEFRVML